MAASVAGIVTVTSLRNTALTSNASAGGHECAQRVGRRFDDAFEIALGKSRPQREAKQAIAALFGDAKRRGVAAVSAPGRRRVKRNVVEDGVDAAVVHPRQRMRPCVEARREQIVQMSVVPAL